MARPTTTGTSRRTTRAAVKPSQSTSTMQPIQGTQPQNPSFTNGFQQPPYYPYYGNLNPPWQNLAQQQQPPPQQQQQQQPQYPSYYQYQYPQAGLVPWNQQQNYLWSSSLPPPPPPPPPVIPAGPGPFQVAGLPPLSPPPPPAQKPAVALRQTHNANDGQQNLSLTAPCSALPQKRQQQQDLSSACKREYSSWTMQKSSNPINSVLTSQPCPSNAKQGDKVNARNTAWTSEPKQDPRGLMTAKQSSGAKQAETKVEDGLDDGLLARLETLLQENPPPRDDIQKCVEELRERQRLEEGGVQRDPRKKSASQVDAHRANDLLPRADALLQSLSANSTELSISQIVELVDRAKNTGEAPAVAAAVKDAPASHTDKSQSTCTTLGTTTTGANSLPVDPEKENSNNAEKLSEAARVALEEARMQARIKLQKALQNKKAALERKKQAQMEDQQQPKQHMGYSKWSKQGVRPISALLPGGLDSLLIKDIKSLGPQQLVRFIVSPEPTSDGSEEQEVEDYLVFASKETSSSEEDTTNDNECERETEVLRKRKLELEQLIQQKRQRIKASQEAAPPPESAKPEKITHTREELLKRKRVAAYNFAKTMVAKQEVLLSEREDALSKTASLVRECEKELATSQGELVEAVKKVKTYESRKKSLETILSEKVSALVQKRQRLHSLREHSNSST